jgi:hypothetical protein
MAPLLLIGAASPGGGAMYLFDPDHGRPRRGERNIELLQDNWSPGARIVVSAGATVLAPQESC